MEGKRVVHASVINRLDQMMGNVFCHGVSPAEIKQMDWSELEYWDDWLEVMKEAKRQP